MKKITVIIMLLLLATLTACDVRNTDRPSRMPESSVNVNNTVLPTQLPTVTPLPSPVPTPVLPDAKTYLLEKEAQIDPLGDIYYVLEGFFYWDNDQNRTDIKAVLKIRNQSVDPEIYYSFESGKQGQENYIKKTVYSKDGFCYVSQQGANNIKYKAKVEYQSLKEVMQVEDFYFPRTDEMLDGAEILPQDGPDRTVKISADNKELGFFDQYICYAIAQMGFDQSQVDINLVHYIVEYIVMDGVWKEGKLDAIQADFLTAIQPSKTSGECKEIGFSLYTSLLDATYEDAAITPPENLDDYPLLEQG